LRRAAAYLLAALALSGCVVADAAVQETTRSVARGVVNGIVAERFPGVNAAPYTDCIIDNATTGEILTVASASRTGVTEDTVRLVLDVAVRPETVRCLTRTAPVRIGGF
jgi:hypothetical protein